MKVVLHIGLPKTGSSFIQEWLRINSNLVPSLPVDKSSRLATECCDAATFYDRSDFQSINNVSIASVVEEIAAIKAQKTDRIVISSEYFYLAKAENIAEIFCKFELRVEKVICFLRRQDDLLASGYAQDVKALSRTKIFDLEECNDVYDWLELQSNYKAAFPNADFVPLEFGYIRNNGGLLSSWKREIDCIVDTIDTIPGGDIVNISLPAELVEICRIGNHSGDKLLTDFSIYAASCGIVSSNYRLPKHIREQIREKYSKKNDLFVSLLKNPASFESYTSGHWNIDDLEASDHLSPEVVSRLLRFAISNFSAEGSIKIVNPRGHGHGFRGIRS